ncbi:MAG: GldG family protein [Anaerolineales bacterium]|nr:GldG family protein [Anaerolineales bacterium]
MATKNQPTWHRYTFIALIVAGLAFISTILFLITKGLLVLNMFTGATVDTLNRGTLISLGVTILGLALYVILEPEKIRRAITGRQAKYGSNLFVTSIAFLGILVVVNTLVFQNPKNWDVTQDKSNTLAAETIKALETLPSPVVATGFYSSASPDNAAELLEKFKAASNGKFSYKFVNPDTDPLSAREAGITGDGKILLEMGDQKEIASYASETELAKALIKLINPTARAVYFLTGHGEVSLDSGETSLATAKQTLESKNYTVNTLNLLAENKIPEDALAIIIAGPQKQISSEEAKLLKAYVDAGGSLLVMEDPLLATKFGDAPDPLANYLTKDWGITLDNDIIIDLNSQQPLNAISASAGDHPINANLSANYIVIMPQARSITMATAPEGIVQTPLLFTSQNSWGEINFTNAEGTQVSFDEGDLPGPLVMAAAGENPTTKGRVVVFGNSLFATDQAFDAYGNGNIFVNSVDWAAEQDNLINITPNTPTTRTFLPPSQIQLLIILLVSILLIPGLVIFAGISSWLARRRQG